jgi:hypothetical protein
LSRTILRRAARSLHSSNAAAFVNIAIGFTAYAAGAHSQRTESTSHLSGFLFVQLTRAFAEQYSVLVIHFFSPLS